MPQWFHVKLTKAFVTGETNRQQISKVVRPVSYNGVVSAAPRRPAPSMPTVNGSISPTETTKQAANILNAVPETPLLDTSANKSKAQLVKSGSLANRNPPSKASSHTVGFTDFVPLQIGKVFKDHC